MAQVQTVRLIKGARSNRRGEYLNKELQEHLSRCETVHELTATYSSHQNGVAECMNRILLSLVRAILHCMHVSEALWVEGLVLLRM